MKNYIVLILLIVFAFSILNIPNVAEAKSRGGAYYKSADTGRFTSKKSYYSSPKTVYKSYRK